jgi:hypothetical protein
MSFVPTVAFNITELEVNYNNDSAMTLGRCRGSHFMYFLLKLWFKDLFLAFSCAIVVKVIFAAIIGTSKIVGKKANKAFGAKSILLF